MRRLRERLIELEKQEIELQKQQFKLEKKYARLREISSLTVAAFSIAIAVGSWVFSGTAC